MITMRNEIIDHNYRVLIPVALPDRPEQKGPDRSSVSVSSFCKVYYTAVFFEMAGCHMPGSASGPIHITPGPCYNINTGFGVRSVNIGCHMG